MHVQRDGLGPAWLQSLFVTAYGHLPSSSVRVPSAKICYILIALPIQLRMWPTPCSSLWLQERWQLWVSRKSIAHASTSNPNQPIRWLLAILGSLVSGQLALIRHSANRHIQGPRLVLNIRREHQRMLPDSLDDVRLSVDYARVSTDDSIPVEEPAKPSRVSFGSWKSRISWHRSSLHWMPKASEKHSEP